MHPWQDTQVRVIHLFLDRQQLSLVPDDVGPSVDVRVDYLSLTARFESDEAIAQLRTAVTSTVLEHFETREASDMEFTGNYLEGVVYRRAGIVLRWTSFTRCKLNGFSEEGRCAGTMNLSTKGKTGIGMAPLHIALSFIKSLVDLGFESAARWDLAVDCYDQAGISPSDIYEELAAGRWRVPRRQSCTLYGSFKQGSKTFITPTIYLGAIKSDNFVRIYDRAAVLEEERLITRFERQTRGKFAQSLLESFQALANVAWGEPCAEQRFREWLLSAVRSSCDIRKVGQWAHRELPANWAKLSDPAWLMDVVFGQTKPLEIGDVVIRGGYAASMRHCLRSSSRVLAMHCIEVFLAQGHCPDEFLHLFGYKLEHLSEEDYQDLVQHSEGKFSLNQIRKACASLQTQWYGLKGGRVSVTDLNAEEADRLDGELGGVVTPPQNSQSSKKAS